jgi:hypothetical protein
MGRGTETKTKKGSDATKGRGGKGAGEKDPKGERPPRHHKHHRHHDHDDGCGCGCDIDIQITDPGEVNIYNCSSPPSGGKTQGDGGGGSDGGRCPWPEGTCIPVAAGAKHKLSREQKLNRLAEGTPVPSALAASVIQMMRRYTSGESPGNDLEASVFPIFGKIGGDLVNCTLSGFDSLPKPLTSKLYDQSLLADPSQPLDEDVLTKALADEVVQRMGLLVFNDPQGMGQERPGKMRVEPPQGEITPSQVRICKVNGLRTANWVPDLSPGDWTPDEIQHQCSTQIVNGQPILDCEVQTSNCPGNTLNGGVCGRVLNVAYGDGILLEGVNFFSVDAKVRFTDPQTANPVRDVDTQVWGDVDTPVTDSNGQLINDCRVDDRLTFNIPDDLAPGIYWIQVVVPNTTGIPEYGPELTSTTEFLNVLPSPNDRFEIVTEWINAREETSPAWWGSDEVGLHTMAAAWNTSQQDGSMQLIDLPDFIDPNYRPLMQDRRFKDLEDMDFDSGTNKDITRPVFQPDEPWLGMVLVVLGDEIDSSSAYHHQVTQSWDYFVQLVKEELPYISAAVGYAGKDLLDDFSWTKVIVEGAALLLLAGIDGLIALWAPADPIIRDTIALSVNDFANLTSANAPAPAPTTYDQPSGIKVDINKTIPPVKGPLEYHETRQYRCADQDSAYEITYRFARTA